MTAGASCSHPGPFLGEDGETEFVPPPQTSVQVIQLRRGMDYGGEGIRYGLLQFTHHFSVTWEGHRIRLKVLLTLTDIWWERSPAAVAAMDTAPILDFQSRILPQ